MDEKRADFFVAAGLPTMTLSAALDCGAKKIGLLEATMILSHITGRTRAELYIRGETALKPDDAALCNEAICRVLAGEPLQYILGTWDFCGIRLRVDPRALIPRPETELLAQMAARHIQAATEGVRVCDMCTGSGCIAIVLAEHAHVVAVDVSDAALALAAENIAACKVLGRVSLVKSDLFADVSGTFDCIVANPPYVKTDEYLSPECAALAHEPRIALDGGADGCDIYRRLITQAHQKLNPGGRIFLEIGPTEVRDLLEAAGFTDISAHNDLAGIPRILTGGKHV